MRLFQRNKTWWVEIQRGMARSLRTEDKAEAEAIINEMMVESIKGKIGLASKVKPINLSKFAELYLDAKSDRSPFTEEADRRTFRLLKDAIGDIPVCNITYEDIIRFKKSCRARNVRGVSINSYLNHIKAALRWAKKRGYLAEVPEIEKEREYQKQFRYLTPAEIKSLLSVALAKRGHGFFAYLLFLLYTGARRQEAVHAVINLEQGIATLTKTKGKRDRIVPLAPMLIDVLRPLNGAGFGLPSHADTLTHWFHEVAQECGLEVSLHDLRHNAATYMIKANMNPRVVQAILGHQDFKTTERYAHVDDDVTRQEMGKLSYLQ